jgi:ribosomal protein S27AE
MKVISPRAEAASKETSPDQLAVLGQSSDVRVHRVLARNPHAPAATLELLSHSSDKATRRNVVLNPNAPTDVLLKLAPQFPRFFFKNPAFDWLILENPDLLIDLGQGVLKNILKALECPESFMRWAIEFGSEEEKLAVAMNVNAPVQCLQELSMFHGNVRSAALGHTKLAPEPVGLNMEEVFLIELKDHLHSLSCVDAQMLLAKNLIDLPQYPFLNSAVRAYLAKSRANPSISVECYMDEVKSTDPHELMEFLWWCKRNFEFDDVPLEEVRAVISPDYFQAEHIQSLSEVVEKRLSSFLFNYSNVAFRKIRGLDLLFSCVPPEATFPDSVYRLLHKCSLQSRSAKLDLQEVFQAAIRLKHCPDWFKEQLSDTPISSVSYKKTNPAINVDAVISCLRSIRLNWVANDKEVYETNRKLFEEAIGDCSHLRRSKLQSDDLERIFLVTFDLYALIDQQIVGWDEQETTELRIWVQELIWHLFQSAACPRELLDEVTEQKDKRFAGLISFAKSVLDLRLNFSNPKNSDWFLKRQRRIKDPAVLTASAADNILFIRESKARTACNNNSLIARVLGLCHPFAEPKSLAKRCKSLYWIERFAVARNPNTPLNILELLSRDSHVLVSRQAELTKSRPRNIGPKALTRDSTVVQPPEQPMVHADFVGKELELISLCPNCGGRIVYFEPDEAEAASFNCKGTAPTGEGCGFAVKKVMASRVLAPDEVDSLMRDKRFGPIDGFRSKANWPFKAALIIKYDDEAKNYKLEFDFDDDKVDEELVDLSDQTSLGSCPKCGAGVFVHGRNYVCEKSVGTLAQPSPDCDFKCGQVILQQPITNEQIRKLLETGKTDMLNKFVSMRTRRAFKAMLIWDAEVGKINFEFGPVSSSTGSSVSRKRRLKPPLQFQRKPAAS